MADTTRAGSKVVKVDGDESEKTTINATEDLDASTVDPDQGDNVEAGAGKPESADEADPDTVDWDGPEDAENPMSWPMSKKWLNVSILSLLTIVTPLGSSMFAPGIPAIMLEFHSTSTTTATFLVSIYILGFAFGPLLIAPLSEIYGRRPLYIFGNVLFAIFTVCTALSNSIGMLLAFRFLMGLAGSVPITIGSGSIADMMPVEMRGRALSAWALGPLLGPCIGPVAGGFLIRAAGWRWVYWLIAMLSGIFIPVSYIFLRETFAPVILENKTRRLRRQTGNDELRSKLTGRNSPKMQFKLAIIRPVKLLLVTPIVTLNALYVAITYGILYLLITTFSFVYTGQYGFNEGTSGLAFLPAGLGMMIGVVGFGYLSDAMVQRNKAAGIAHKPEVRLAPALTIPSGLALPVGLFIYGWTTDKGVHWIVPMVGVVIFTAGLMGVMMSVQNYLLDTYPRYAASVTAALTVLRSLLGALLPLGGLQMYDTLGLGWGNSLLAFVSLALVPIPLLFFTFGKAMMQTRGSIIAIALVPFAILALRAIFGGSAGLFSDSSSPAAVTPTHIPSCIIGPEAGEEREEYDMATSMALGDIATSLLYQKDLELVSCTTLQSLWAGYGHVCAVEATRRERESHNRAERVSLSLILKYISPPPSVNVSDEGHLRKVLSYQVEQHFYTHLAPLLPESVAVAECIASINDGKTTALVLKDLKSSAVDLRPSLAFPVSLEKRGELNSAQTYGALDWLAGFHGHFWGKVAGLPRDQMVRPPLEEVERQRQRVADGEGHAQGTRFHVEGVWLNGGYTYLATRRNEYANLARDGDDEWSEVLCTPSSDGGPSLAERVAAFLAPGSDSSVASSISKYETLIHGDVKSENMFASASGKQVAFVDFHRLETVAGKEYPWDVFVKHWEAALVDWLRFQASWGFWGNTEWLEARILASPDHSD
ncbi:transporter [Seiridium cupressi]